MTVLTKLLLVFATPTLILFVVFSLVAYEVARRDLEAELGTRLAAVAASAATQIRGKYLVNLAAGDEASRAYKNVRRKLQAVARATGVARLYIFDRQFVLRVDTRDPAPIGRQDFAAKLDRHELLGVFERGAPIGSLMFTDRDGVRVQSGYAPVRMSEDDRSIVLAMGVDAPAAYFARLVGLRRSLVLYGLFLAAVVLSISVVTAALITRPVRRLAVAAERIGKGELSHSVERTSRDEIGFLADTMEEMRRELAARDEKMQLMLSGIAHEVRNPLGGIDLFTGLLRDELAEGDPRREHVRRIERELGHLKAVVDEFLDYARRPRLQWGRVAVAALVAEVVELVRGEAHGKGVVIDVDSKELFCRGDAQQLRRALLNLLRNAIQASSGAGGGQVRISATATARGVELSVYNSGPAILPRVRERMFEPFFTTREKGTGLGLAFVREIMAEHGGAVTVRSREGEGTTFALTLPSPPQPQEGRG